MHDLFEGQSDETPPIWHWVVILTGTGMKRVIRAEGMWQRQWQVYGEVSDRDTVNWVIDGNVVRINCIAWHTVNMLLRPSGQGTWHQHTMHRTIHRTALYDNQSTILHHTPSSVDIRAWRNVPPILRSCSTDIPSVPSSRIRNPS